AIIVPVLFVLLAVQTAGLLRRSGQIARTEIEEARDRHLIRALMDNSPDRIYVKDNESRFVHISRELARVFGLNDPAEAVGKTDADFFAPEFAQQCRADELEVIRTGKPLLGKEEKEIHPDGRVTWAVTTTLPLRGTRGEVIGVLGL